LISRREEAPTTHRVERWLPRFDASADYSTIIHASPQRVYDVARHADFGGSLITRILFSLRSFDFTLSRTVNVLKPSFDGLIENGFILLEENPPNEIVLGLVGKFWTASGCVQKITADEFKKFEQSGFAKVACNFLLTPQTDGTTILSTETRILCTDGSSKKKFLRYWFFIGPFSGLIRREMLRSIKKKVELTDFPAVTG
jgi:hypothetical protein